MGGSVREGANHRGGLIIGKGCRAGQIHWVIAERETNPEIPMIGICIALFRVHNFIAQFRHSLHNNCLI